MYQDTPPAGAGAGLQLPQKELAELALRHFPSAQALAAMLDHTLLKPEATRQQTLALAAEAAEWGFACAMVNPAWVPTVREALRGTGVRVGTVIGFPLGASLAVSKQTEARHAARAGALDLDMVLCVGALRSGLDAEVLQDIRGVCRVARDEGAIVKVILETCLLNEEEKRRATELCLEAGVDFVKTSTGFSTGGATVEDIRLLRGMVHDRCGVKASGGIRTLSDAARMAEAGASRIGASASVSILKAYSQQTLV